MWLDTYAVGYWEVLLIQKNKIQHASCILFRVLRHISFAKGGKQMGLKIKISEPDMFFLYHEHWLVNCMSSKLQYQYEPNLSHSLGKTNLLCKLFIYINIVQIYCYKIHYTLVMDNIKLIALNSLMIKAHLLSYCVISYLCEHNCLKR